MTLLKWEPELELERLAERMNRLLDGRFSFTGEREWILAVDVTEDDKEITVKASVPGVTPGDLDVSLENDVLVIKGKTSSESEEKKDGWLMRERRRGSFYRSLSLPDSVDEDKAEVTLKDGELTIKVPLAKTEERKKLTVRSGA